MARLALVTTPIPSTWKCRRLPAGHTGRAPSRAEDPCLSTGPIDEEREGVAPWTHTKGSTT